MKYNNEMTFCNVQIKIIGILILIAIFPISDACAVSQTHSRAEIKRFSDARAQLARAESAEEIWDGIHAMETFRTEFPHTFLKGDATAQLFHSYRMVVDDAGFLLNLAQEAIALIPNRNGLYEQVVQTFVEKRLFPDQTLAYARKSLELAEKMHAQTGTYSRQIIRRRVLLSRSFQLADQREEALKVIRRSLQQAEALPVTAFPDKATRQKTVHGIRLDLLRLYIEQKRWDPAYELACDLLKNSVIRESVYELWSGAYVGKFGTADGIIYAYADLKDEIEESRRTRLIEERVMRPAPAFALKTLEDQQVSLDALKGKVVLLNFWASWCGPCLEELPQLEALTRTYKQESVAIIAVNLDTQEEGKRKDLISDTKERLAPSLTFLMGNDELRREFGFNNIPYTCIVDREGYIRYEKTGLSSDFKASIKDQLTWVIGLPEAE
ncbi:MAG: TlpA disulfide reductase family protein [Gemmatimonadota bacterium]|nr:TlpA disulfide reductase family protein [Gemmatimonadota bacterium]